MYSEQMSVEDNTLLSNMCLYNIWAPAMCFDRDCQRSMACRQFCPGCRFRCNTIQLFNMEAVVHACHQGCTSIRRGFCEACLLLMFVLKIWRMQAIFL